MPERVAEFDPEGRKVVTEGGKTSAYDFLVVATGLQLEYGLIEGMDKQLIGKHGMGDIAGVPKGKTAAGVKWQVSVAVDHLVAEIAGTASQALYTGYTSCPLITRLGRAMLRCRAREEKAP